jgi:branched-chain amino acid transport system permease protein
VNLVSFLQQCLIGLTSGGFLGLIAVGYTLVYGTVGLIHFAHGDVVMLGGCLAVTALALAGPLPLEPLAGWLLVMVVAIGCGLFCGCLNVAIDRVVYRPLRQAPPLAPLVSAVGVSFILMNIGLLWIGPTDQAFPEVLPTGDRLAAGVWLPTGDLLVLAIVLPALGGLAVLLRKTGFGRSLRSVAAVARAASRTSGPERFITGTFFLGGFLGGLASVAAGIHATTINYQLGYQTGLYALTAAVLGGIGSVPGAIVGGLLVGLVRAVSVAIVGPRWAVAAVFLVLIVVLAFRPQGLFGRPAAAGRSL